MYLLFLCVCTFFTFYSIGIFSLFYFLFHYNFSSIYKTAQTRPITSLYRLVRCCTFYLKKYVQLPCVSIIIPYSRNRFS